MKILSQIWKQDHVMSLTHSNVGPECHTTTNGDLGTATPHDGEERARGAGKREKRDNKTTDAYIVFVRAGRWPLQCTSSQISSSSSTHGTRARNGQSTQLHG
eukprot:150171-Prymnesium_polylepis.2